MNWEMLGAIGELVGAGGVIASLLYLATQVRGSASQARQIAVKSVLDKVNGVFSSMVGDEEVCEVWVLGAQGPSKLRTEAERVRFSALLFTMMKPYEELFHYRVSGAVDDWAWEGIRANMDAVLGSSGFDDWWSARSSWFSEDFRRHVEDVLARAPRYALPSRSWAGEGPSAEAL